MQGVCQNRSVISSTMTRNSIVLAAFKYYFENLGFLCLTLKRILCNRCLLLSVHQRHMPLRNQIHQTQMPLRRQSTLQFCSESVGRALQNPTRSRDLSGLSSTISKSRKAIVSNTFPHSHVKTQARIQRRQELHIQDDKTASFNQKLVVGATSRRKQKLEFDSFYLLYISYQHFRTSCDRKGEKKNNILLN